MVLRTQEKIAVESATRRELRGLITTRQGGNQGNRYPSLNFSRPPTCQFLPLAKLNWKPMEKRTVWVVFITWLRRTQSRVEREGGWVWRGKRWKPRGLTPFCPARIAWEDGVVVAFLELDIVCIEQHANTRGLSWVDHQLLRRECSRTIAMEILLVEMMKKLFFFFSIYFYW